MSLLLSIPFPYRLTALFVLGVCLGSLVNLAVYRLAWNRRAISPWSRPPKGGPARRGDDRVPIFGWLGLRREAALHGSGFWIRPMLVEVLCGFGLPWLYWWEIHEGALLPFVFAPVPVSLLLAMHVQFVGHVLLITLMLIASLIDADEKTIPDYVTVPGTLLGLFLAAVYPWSLLPAAAVPVPQPEVIFLRLTAPLDWPAWLGGFPSLGSLGVGLGCWWLWCVGLLPRTWYARHGWRRAFGLFWSRLRRDASTRPILLLGLFGSVAISLVWFSGSGRWAAFVPRWEGLLTALVGMAAGGGIIWAVRIIGKAVLQKEAMGFGDVTLMAMIGAFLGWQACLIIFFLAPLAGLVIGLIILALRRDHEIPYGPFLCLATLVILLRWASFWNAVSGIFALGLIVPLILLVCLGLMAVLLGLWRLIQHLLGWA